MKRTPLSRGSKRLERRTPLRAKTPMRKKREKKRRVVARAIKPWREWYEDGKLVRLVCNEKNSVPGRKRYNGIRDEMYERDGGICWKETGGCGLPILKGEETFDHTDGRCAGRRNDLPEYVNAQGEVVRNHVMHWLCNGRKGSRRMS